MGTIKHIFIIGHPEAGKGLHGKPSLSKLTGGCA